MFIVRRSNGDYLVYMNEWWQWTPVASIADRFETREEADFEAGAYEGAYSVELSDSDLAHYESQELAAAAAAPPPDRW